MGCGWTFAELGRTTLPQVWQLLKYMREFPPAHILLRGFVGWKGAEEEEEGEVQMPPELESAPLNSNLPEAVRRDIEAMRKVKGVSK